MNEIDLTGNAGQLLVNYEHERNIVLQASHFLKDVAAQFAQNCARFFDTVEYMPFLYTERQLQGELLPAVHKVADVIFFEIPIKRGTEGGRLDYLVRYRDEYVFFVEVKFDWMAIKGRSVRKQLVTSWQEAHSQLDSLSSNDIVIYARDFDVKNIDNVAKIALLITPAYQSSKYSASLQLHDKSTALDIHQRLLNGLAPRPNINLTWYIHQRLQQPINFEDQGRCEIYSCVAMMANVWSEIDRS